MVAVYNICGPKSGTSLTCLTQSVSPLNLRFAALAIQVLLRSGASPHDLDKAQRSVLHWAADAANHHALNTLIASSAIPPSLINAQARISRTQFCCLFSLSGSLRSNIPVSFLQDADGNTALHLAVESNSSACVEALLKNGASMCLRNARGILACDVASNKIRRDMLENPAGLQCRSMILCVCDCCN
jgi:ankyrin repeat protein